MDRIANSPRVAAAAIGIAGVAMIAVSFGVNGGPPPYATDDGLVAFAASHRLAIVAGAWLQAVGTLALGAFALMLASPPLAQARAKREFVLLGVCALVTVSLLEVTFYLFAAHAASGAGARFSVEAIQAVQHLYFVVAAPAVFVSLGCAINGSASLPRPFAIGAWVLGAVFFVLGLTTLSQAALSATVTSLGSAQAVWWLAAAVMVCRAPKQPTGARDQGSGVRELAAMRGCGG